LKIVGFLILTPIQSSSWQIKNAVSFPSAPKGTSEALIYTALKDLHEEEEKALASGQQIPHPANGFTNGEPIQPTANGGRPPADAASEASSASGVSVSSVGSTSSDSEPPTPTPAHRDSSSSLRSSSSNSTESDKTSGSRKGEAPPPSKTHHRDSHRVTVTFGISAAPDFQPIRNLGGWKVKALSKTYSKVASGAKLINRGEFRSKFDSEHDPMYVCYPPDGFGLDGVNALLKVLRK